MGRFDRLVPEVEAVIPADTSSEMDMRPTRALIAERQRATLDEGTRRRMPGDPPAPLIIGDPRDRRIAELEAALRGVPSTRVSFDNEWYLSGVRMKPGVYIVVRVSEEAFSPESPF